MSSTAFLVTEGHQRLFSTYIHTRIKVWPANMPQVKVLWKIPTFWRSHSAIVMEKMGLENNGCHICGYMQLNLNSWNILNLYCDWFLMVESYFFVSMIWNPLLRICLLARDLASSANVHLIHHLPKHPRATFSHSANFKHIWTHKNWDQIRMQTQSICRIKIGWTLMTYLFHFCYHFVGAYSEHKKY